MEGSGERGEIGEVGWGARRGKGEGGKGFRWCGMECRGCGSGRL